MTILGYAIPGAIIGLAIVIALSIASDRAEREAEAKNERFPTPSWHQIAWSIRHARQDLRLIALLLTFILLTLWIKL